MLFSANEFSPRFLCKKKKKSKEKKQNETENVGGLMADRVRFMWVMFCYETSWQVGKMFDKTNMPQKYVSYKIKKQEKKTKTKYFAFIVLIHICIIFFY